MALRVRELNRRETVVERQAREEEQLILRKLEDCKQIPKNDRLELREQIHRRSEGIIQLFRRHMKHPKHLQDLQIALRKYLAKLKVERESEVLENIKAELLKSIDKLEESKGQVKTQKLSCNPSEPRFSRQRWFRQALQRSASRRKSENKSQGGVGLGSNSCSKSGKPAESGMSSPYAKPFVRATSAVQSPITSEYNLRSSELFDWKSNIKGPSLTPSDMAPQALFRNMEGCHQKQLSDFTSFNFYSPQPGCLTGDFLRNVTASNVNLGSIGPSFLTPQNNFQQLFTDPRMLAECRGFLSKSKTNEIPTLTASFPQQARTVETQFGTISQNSVCLTPKSQQQKFAKDMFHFFRGKTAEEVVGWFFDTSPILSRKEFKDKLRAFLKAHLLIEESEVNIDGFFDAVSDIKVRNSTPEKVTVSQLGRLADQYCPKAFTNSETKDLFQRLDTQNLGRLVRCLFSDSRWTALFAKADYDDKGYIGYWELFSARQSWEYMNFLSWRREKQPSSELGIAFAGAL